MTISSFPFDNSAAYESSWLLLMRPLMPACVIEVNRSHIDLNKFEVYADSTGMQVKVKSGAAYIEGFYVISTSQETRAIATADATNPRIDRVVLEMDAADNEITLIVLTGTPASSPTPPSLTQTDTLWQMSIAQVYVGAGVSTIAAGNVTSERVFFRYMKLKAMGTYMRKHLGIVHTTTNQQVGTGDGIDGLPIPQEYSGYNIVNVICTVHTQGVTGTMDVQIRRRRSGSNVDVLSTKVTVGAEYYAQDGVVNTSNDDLQVGDMLFVDVDTVHSTPAYGLSVVIICELP